jgi:hypothetical protein
MNQSPIESIKIKAILVVLFLLLFCLGSTPTTSEESEYSPSESREANIEFFTLEIPDSVGEGFEPHIVVGPGIDGNEWIYIDSPTGLGSQLSGNLWISKDGGFSWEFKETGRPPINYGGSGDSYSAIFSDGTIVFTDLYLVTVTVDTSLDGGETWLQNPQASVTPIDDRQWLEIGPTVGGGPGSSSETLYLVYNQIPVGLIIQKSRITNTGFGWIRGNGGLPVSTSTGSRDYFDVDQNDGTLYLPNKESGSLVVYVSTDGANTFSRHVVLDSAGDIQNIFTAVDVDRVGNVYLTWANEKEHVFLGVSTDKGQSWEVIQVTQTPGTRVLPWITAGDAGRVGLTWYETENEGDSDDTYDMENATWDVKAAFCINALSDNRTFLITTIHENMHEGTIKTTGASSDDADRDLGDFFNCDIDSLGRMVVTYGVDGNDGANARQSAVWYGKQTDGPFLYENMGPIANFTNETHGLEVTFDGSSSIDLNGNGIAEYLWDFGDGTNGTGEVTDHRYNKTGDYYVTLRVINEDGLANSTTSTVTLSIKKEGFNAFVILLVLLLILTVAAVVYRILRKGGGQKPQPIVVEPEA